MNHLRITQAGAVSALTFLVGQIVAFVPSIQNDQEALISAGSAVIAAVFLVANAVHHLADSNVSAKDVEAGAVAAVRGELGRIDLNSLAAQAVAGNIPPVGDLEARAAAAAKVEVGRILAGLAQPPAVAPVPAPPPPAAA